MSQIETIALSIYETEFDEDSTFANLSSITGWLSENIGLLNTLIHTNFSGEDPNFGLEEIAIYKELYLCNYYNKMTRNILRGISSTSSSDNIISVSDGDNRIQFANKNEIAKTYKDLAKECKVRLDSLVSKYNIYASKPLQIGGVEAASIDVEDVSGAVTDSGGSVIFDGTIFDGGVVQ
jgi:hypothetical protein